MKKYYLLVFAFLLILNTGSAFAQHEVIDFESGTGIGGYFGQAVGTIQDTASAAYGGSSFGLEMFVNNDDLGSGTFNTSKPIAPGVVIGNSYVTTAWINATADFLAAPNGVLDARVILSCSLTGANDGQRRAIGNHSLVAPGWEPIPMPLIGVDLADDGQGAVLGTGGNVRTQLQITGNYDVGGGGNPNASVYFDDIETYDINALVPHEVIDFESGTGIGGYFGQAVGTIQDTASAAYDGSSFGLEMFVNNDDLGSGTFNTSKPIAPAVVIGNNYVTTAWINATADFLAAPNGVLDIRVILSCSLTGANDGQRRAIGYHSLSAPGWEQVAMPILGIDHADDGAGAALGTGGNIRTQLQITGNYDVGGGGNPNASVYFDDIVTMEISGVVAVDDWYLF